MVETKHFVEERRSREYLITNIIKDTNNVVCANVKDRGHRNGPERFELTDKGIIKTYNNITNRHITDLIARPSQIYDRLEDSFKFYKWLYKNKYYSSKEFESIDRIDSSKGYSPENCRLVSKEFNTRYINGVVQKKYKYSNTNLYYKAKKQIPFETIKSRNKLGWKQEDIISRPVEKHSITIGIISINCILPPIIFSTKVPWSCRRCTNTFTIT